MEDSLAYYRIRGLQRQEVIVLQYESVLTAQGFHLPSTTFLISSASEGVKERVDHLQSEQHDFNECDERDGRKDT